MAPHDRDRKMGPISSPMLKHRSAARPRTHKKPDELSATRPNQLWSWDITYLTSDIRGKYFYLYLFLDIFSRKIVGFDVFDEQSAEHAADVVSMAYMTESVRAGEVTLHADNGGPMKGSMMLATLQNLGVRPSFSRPSVSNDNPYSESMFRTLKYSRNILTHHLNPLNWHWNGLENLLIGIIISINIVVLIL